MTKYHLNAQESTVPNCVVDHGCEFVLGIDRFEPCHDVFRSFLVHGEVQTGNNFCKREVCIELNQLCCQWDNGLRHVRII